MINRLEQLQNFQEDVGSRNALDRLRALQHMQGQDQGLSGLPVVQNPNRGMLPQPQPVGDPRAMLQPPVDPRAMIQNIPQEIQQPTPTISVPISAGGTLELDPNTIETMEGQQGSPFNPILGAAHGGPIVHRMFGGRGIAHPGDSNIHIGDKGIISGGIGDVIRQARAAGFFPTQTQTQAQTSTPVTQNFTAIQESETPSSLEALNADVLSRNGEGALFTYNNQNYQASYEGPTPVNNMTAAGGGPIRYREGGGPLANTAEGLASFGRGGDDILVHMNPEELQGLASMGNITYNPITGLPEAFGLGKFFSNITKPIRKVFKSKTFKALAPLALMIGAPYLASWAMPSVFGAGQAATMFGGALSTQGALGMGLATGLGGFAGNLLAGAKPGDALRQGLMSGVMAGGLHGAMGGPWMGTEAQAAAKAAAAKAATDTASSQLIKQGTATAARQAPARSIAGRGFGTGTNIGTDIARSAGIPGVEGSGFGRFIGPEGTPTGLSTPVQTGTILYPGGESTKMGHELTNIDWTPKTPTSEAFSMEGLKQIPKDIWKDYGNLKGAAKVVGMDLMTPDWEQTYANEKAMQEQLEKAGYSFVNTGFGTQTVILDPSGVTLPSNLSIQDIWNRSIYGGSYQLAPKVTYAPAVGKEGGGIGSLIHRKNSGRLGNIFYNQDKIKEVAENYEGFGGATGRASDARHMAVGNELSKTLSPGIVPDWVGDALSMGILSSKEVIDLISRGFTKENWEAVKEDLTANLKGTFKTPNEATIEDVYKDVYSEGPPVARARGGEFRGQVPGQGHGMEDNVFMPIKDRGKQVGTLAVSPTEYVVDSHTMSALGNGNPDAGAKVMDGVVESVRKKAYGTVRQPNEIDGLRALRPLMERV